MKYLLSLITSIFLINTSFAQFSIGLHGGAATSHTDATPDKTHIMYGANLQYTPTDYIGLKLNISMGELEGGDANDKSLMHYTNDFLQADFNLKIYPVGILPMAQSEPYLYYLSKIYGSIGIGMLRSNSKINYLQDYDQFEFMQNYKGNDITIPLEFGIDIPLGRTFEHNGLYLNLFYRINYLNTDKMDGYIPKLASNQNNDTYTNYGLGISYRF